MRDLQTDDHRRRGAIGAAASIGLRRLWTKVARRPVDTLAILGASAVSVVIVVNAIFLQSGSHPSPFFANPTRLPPKSETRAAAGNAATPKPAESMPANTAAGARTSQTVSSRRSDAIAELIGASIGSPPRVAAVQRALTEFGYGQIKPSGVLDGATSAAIEKFEREHKLAVTGRLSDRLVRELAAMTGRPLD